MPETRAHLIKWLGIAHMDYWAMFNFAVGIWYGCGVPGTVLLWRRNKQESVWWKLMYTVWLLLTGPVTALRELR